MSQKFSSVFGSRSTKSFRWLSFAIVAWAAVGYTACSHPPSHLRTEVYPGAPTPEYLAEKRREVDSLEKRVADLERLSREPSRTYQGSHSAFVTFVEAQKKKLSGAKELLGSLSKPVGTTTPDVMARLDKTLDEQRADLNTAVTE